MEQTIFNQEWDKKEFIIYFELLLNPLTKQEILEFNKGLLPENKGQTCDPNEKQLPENQPYNKSKLSVASYLATRQNLNTLISECLGKNVIIQEGEKFKSNEELFDVFQEKELMLDIWRKSTTNEKMFQHIKFFDDTYSKKVMFIQTLNPIMISVLERMGTAFDEGDNITKIKCEMINAQYQTISTTTGLKSAIDKTNKKYETAYK